MLGIHETEVGLVDQRGRLKRLPRPLSSHLRGGQLFQLIVDERQQLFAGELISIVNGGEDPGDVAHGASRESKPTTLPVPGGVSQSTGPPRRRSGGKEIPRRRGQRRPRPLARNG